jgi:hypothetical protein
MQFQVLDDLFSGKLVAWGFQEGASLEQGPTPIPAHLFPRDAEDTAVLDWRNSTLKASSFFFDRIRVTEPRARTPRNKRVSGPTSKQAKPSSAPSAVPAPTPIISKSPKKKGRPRVAEKTARPFIRTAHSSLPNQSDGITQPTQTEAFLSSLLEGLSWSGNAGNLPLRRARKRNRRPRVAWPAHASFFGSVCAA